MLVSKPDLVRLIGSVNKVVKSRNTIPILGNVRLVADGGRLTATATDLDIVIAGSIEAEGDIACCVDAKTFAAAVAKAPDMQITLDHDNGTLTVRSGRSRYKFPTLPVEDFPDFGTGDFTAEFDFDFHAAIQSVQFAVSTEETRYYLNGVFFQTDSITATDGHRLSTAKIETGAGFAPVIVPRKLLPLVPKGAHISLSKTKIRFATPDVTITSKLIDGAFPDYERVIPRDADNRIIVDAAAMKDAVERVTVIDSKDMRVRLEIGAAEILLSTAGKRGDVVDVVPCQYNGEPFEVGFNGAYLAEIMSVVPAGDVTIALADGSSPALITSDQADGLRIVLMPVRAGGA